MEFLKPLSITHWPCVAKHIRAITVTADAAGHYVLLVEFRNGLTRLLADRQRQTFRFDSLEAAAGFMHRWGHETMQVATAPAIRRHGIRRMTQSLLSSLGGSQP